MNVGPWWKAKRQSFLHLHLTLDMLPSIMVLFCSFTHLFKRTQITPKIQSFFSSTTPDAYIKMSLQSIHNFCWMKYLESADLLGRGRSLLTPESRSTRFAVAWKYALMNAGDWWKANFKASGQLPAPHSGHAATIIYGVVLLIYSTKTQITPKVQSDLSVTIPDPAIKCYHNPFINFLSNVHKQTNKPTLPKTYLN